jgi:hypothetical protein
MRISPKITWRTFDSLMNIVALPAHNSALQCAVSMLGVGVALALAVRPLALLVTASA